MLDSRQMCVFHAADERTPKIEDSLAEDAVCCEPLSGLRLYGGLQNRSVQGLVNKTPKSNNVIVTGYGRSLVPRFPAVFPSPARASFL
jgi:hypothetical protein